MLNIWMSELDRICGRHDIVCNLNTDLNDFERMAEIIKKQRMIC